jgi:hypothetical protein
MIINDDNQDKQEYLRVNIIDQGYSADEFMEYLKLMRGENGLHIENWSKNDLIKAVDDFKRVYHKNENNNNNEEAAPKIVKELIGCKKTEDTDITKNDNIIISISLPKVNEGVIFFQKSYITYLLETKPLGYQVRRRFSDFLWLHDTLKTVYANCIIPPLIKKNYLMGITSAGIEKRMRVLEKFIREISIHPLLRNSQIFYDFISVIDDQDFNTKKNSYSKLEAPQKAEDFKTLTGEIDVSINKDKELYAEKIKKICESNEEIMKKISKEYKLLNVQIQNVITKMNTISTLWNDLCTKSVNNDEGKVVNAIYESMSKFMNNWAEMQQNQIDLINIKIREYFRYIKNEFHYVKEYFNDYEYVKTNYKKNNQKLMEKKRSLFDEKKIDDWGLDKEDLENKVLLFREKELSIEKMLPEETKKVKDKKKLYGCYLNSFINEYENIKYLNSERHKINIGSFIKETSKNIIDFHLKINAMIAYIDAFHAQAN